MQKHMLAALLAISSASVFAAGAKADPQSHGSYFIHSGAPAVMSAPVVQSVQTQSAVIAPTESATILTPSSTILMQQPMLNQTLVMPAVITMPAGFSMDPAALQLYRGPRLENTLTMPDPNTYLRP